MTGREERMHNVEVRNQELITQYTELMQSFYFSLSKLSAKTKRQYLSQIHVTFTGIYGKGYTDADILGTDMDKINKYFTSRRSVVNEAIISQQLYALNKFFNYLVRSEGIKACNTRKGKNRISGCRTRQSGYECYQKWGW